MWWSRNALDIPIMVRISKGHVKRMCLYSTLNTSKEI